MSTPTVARRAEEQTKVSQLGRLRILTRIPNTGEPLDGNAQQTHKSRLDRFNRLHPQFTPLLEKAPEM